MKIIIEEFQAFNYYNILLYNYNFHDNFKIAMHVK